MADRHDLPSGGWFELRDPKTVPERACRPIRRAIQHLSTEGAAALEAGNKQDLSTDDVDALWDVNDTLAAALVTAWSVDAAVSVESVGELPRADYDALATVVAPLLADVFFDGQPKSPEDLADPKASSGS